MASTLTIRLLGRFAVAIGGLPVELPTRKAAALLAVLAREPGRPHAREKLAALLWPLSDATQARASLRQALAQLRRALGDVLAGVADSVQLRATDVDVDVVRLEAALASGDTAVVDLYAGTFLDDLTLREEPFEEWRRAEATRLGDRATELMRRFLDAAVAAGDVEQAAAVGERLLAFDPGDEEAHRALMVLHIGRGAAGAAMRQYERCRAALDRTLGVAPSPETEALRRRIAAPAATAAVEPVAGPPTLAVMPFVDLAAEPDDRYLALGIAEDVIAEVSRFRPLRVIARHSSFAMAERGLDPAEAARRLGARYLLTGSVRRHACAIRVVVELIDGQTGHYLWTHRYDLKADGIADVLADIGRAVALALVPRIDAALLQEGRRKPIDGLGNYDLWLRALARLREGTPEANVEARRCLERALAADPDCARAHAGLSLTWFNEWSCRAWDRWEETAANAQRHAAEAVARDPADHMTHAILGRILLYRRDFARAERHIERALALNPNDADMLVQAALAFAYLGDAPRGIAVAEDAMRANPLHEDWYYVFAFAPRLMVGDYAAAIDLGMRAPDATTDMRALIAVADAGLGRTGAAARQMALFHAAFRANVTHGRPPEPGEEARWIFHVNPLRRPEDRAFLRAGLAAAGLDVPPDAGEAPAPG
ncbi:MAG: BTAD domain-containing putative transcriptional regulator [Alphaproteobacteria bacterium]